MTQRTFIIRLTRHGNRNLAALSRFTRARTRLQNCIFPGSRFKQCQCRLSRISDPALSLLWVRPHLPQQFRGQIPLTSVEPCSGLKMGIPSVLDVIFTAPLEHSADCTPRMSAAVHHCNQEFIFRDSPRTSPEQRGEVIQVAFTALTSCSAFQFLGNALPAGGRALLRQLDELRILFGSKWLPGDALRGFLDLRRA